MAVVVVSGGRHCLQLGQLGAPWVALPIGKIRSDFRQQFLAELNTEILYRRQQILLVERTYFGSTGKTVFVVARITTIKRSTHCLLLCTTINVARQMPDFRARCEPNDHWDSLPSEKSRLAQNNNSSHKFLPGLRQAPAAKAYAKSSW
jgi:hypothetical protein